MAKNNRADRIDPAWPAESHDGHPVSELAADRQGGLSPFGETTFPIDGDKLPYTHPVTEINK
ncbi:MAG: hypothetical protein J2O49_11830 [Sciscionella sp.]|nr:hypothetical protein [Sciscionella sp.]